MQLTPWRWIARCSCFAILAGVAGCDGGGQQATPSTSNRNAPVAPAHSDSGGLPAPALEPPAGSDVLSAGFIAPGEGWVVTTQGLLLTGDGRQTWPLATPPGLTP